MIVHVLDNLENLEPDFIYEMLAKVRVNLCLDVGAGAGDKALKMLANAQQAQVICFEPFPGNIGFLTDSLYGEPRGFVVQAAAAACNSEARFAIPSVVNGSEEGWETRQGYSSLGYMQHVSTLKDLARQILDYTRHTRSISVSTVRLDNFIHVNHTFVKIDVQGGEYEVLRGLTPSMRAGQVDIIYAEFSGDARILRLLDKLDYIVYDSFFIWLPGCEDEPNVLRRARRVPLSIGAYAFEGVLDFEDRSFEGYCRKIRNLRKRSRFIQTDLIAIHRSMNATFLEAITQLSKDRADS